VHQPTHLIGIAGPSGAGKTELARVVAHLLCAPVISLDSFYGDLKHVSLQQRHSMNFDIPEALDRDLLLHHLVLLGRGFQVPIPVYDFATHTRTISTSMVKAEPFAVVEGLFALYWQDIRALFGTRVFLAAPGKICLSRRLERDMRERGRSPESVERQYHETVAPMARKYVLPTRWFADVVVSGTDDLDGNVACVLSHVKMQPILQLWNRSRASPARP
jgi:uridine kinase